MTPTPMLQTLNARREATRDILASEQIDSQKELRERLADKGIEVAQATLSRDLVNIRAMKVRTVEDSRVYSVSDIDGAPTHEDEGGCLRLRGWYRAFLVTSILVGHQPVLRATAGGANLLDFATDAVRLGEIMGTIVGDDTILVICRDAADAWATQRYLMELAKPGQMPDLD